jgi:hypothetical protein
MFKGINQLTYAADKYQYSEKCNRGQRNYKRRPEPYCPEDNHEETNTQEPSPFAANFLEQEFVVIHIASGFQEFLFCS